MNNKIQKLIKKLIRQHGTRNPFTLADKLNVLYQFGELGECDGCYMYLKRHRYIFLNQRLSEQESKVVMAHELGHALLHRKENCYFLRNNTFISTNSMEREANTFAAELLIPNEFLEQYKSWNKEQIASFFEIPVQLIDFKNLS